MLDQLYQQTILAHNKAPVGYGDLSTSDKTASGHNLICGDSIEVGLWFNGSTIADVGFNGESCAICTASASMLCEQVKNLTSEQAKQLAVEFIHFLKAEDNVLSTDNKLNIFAALHQIPTRQGCASLPWEALQNALLSS